MRNWWLPTAFTFPPRNERGLIAPEDPHQFLEYQFHRQLNDAWIPSLSCSERTEGRIAIEFVESADLVCAIYGSGTDAFRRKVRVVEDVKVLSPKLELPAFGDGEVFGKLNIPVRCFGQTQCIFPYVPKGSENGRIVVPGHFCRLKGVGRKPAHACSGRTGAGALAIRIGAGDESPAVPSNAGSGDFCPWGTVSPEAWPWPWSAPAIRASWRNPLPNFCRRYLLASSNLSTALPHAELHARFTHFSKFPRNSRFTSR